MCIRDSPKPPHPTTRILAFWIFFWPKTPTFFKIICLEYRSRSLLLNIYYLPVDPNPPDPLIVSGNLFVSSLSTFKIGIKTI